MTTVALATTVRIGRDVARAIEAYERRASRVAWERRWLELTGRPWGWKPPALPRVVVSLGSSPLGLDTKVWVDDLPLHQVASAISITKVVPRGGDIGDLVITIPVALVKVVP